MVLKSCGLYARYSYLSKFIGWNKKWTGCPLKRHLLLWLIETSCNCLKRLQIICLSSSSCITKIPIKKISRRPGMQNFSNLTLNQWMGFWSRIKGKPTIVHNKMTHIPRDCQKVQKKEEKGERRAWKPGKTLCSFARPCSYNYMPWDLYYKLKTWHNPLLLKSLAFLLFTHLYTPPRLPNLYAPQN